MINFIKNLIDLKENHEMLGIKLEFEDEGTSFEEAAFLNEIRQKADTDLIIKIGGCGAINDIRQAQKLNADYIVAPMIESAYALQKFTNSINAVYQKKTPKLILNIETIAGINAIYDILSSKEIEHISGFTIGRHDLANSIGLTSYDIDKPEVFNLTKEAAIKIATTNKPLTIGGYINKKSLQLLKEIPYVTQVETRKILFNANKLIKENDTLALKKALELELAYIYLRQEHLGINNKKDVMRIINIEKRLKEFQTPINV
ncbi:MAG: aldolase/citrate lyase family protein [bacterium]|nr:aldolase/citrate lyase family protein [bacterium]